MGGIKVFWHQSDNFGDKLTPYILDKLGVQYEYVEKGCKEEHYIMCGSILTACNSNSIIWGAGIAQPHAIEKPKQICAVRGEITFSELRKYNIDAPLVFGDPAQVLPLIYFPEKEKKRKKGVLLHMADYPIYKEGHDITLSVESTIDYILESEKIYTSSLHGLITAAAYNIPAKLIQSERVIGQKMKTDDFFITSYDLKKFVKSCLIPEINSLL